MTEISRTYLPAAGHDWFLPLYDPLVKLLGGETARKVLLDQAALRSGQRVLDVGCGTGTFAAMIKRLHPDVEVVGLDPYPKALARARCKAARSRLHPVRPGICRRASVSRGIVRSRVLFFRVPPPPRGREGEHAVCGAARSQARRRVSPARLRRLGGPRAWLPGPLAPLQRPPAGQLSGPRC